MSYPENSDSHMHSHEIQFLENHGLEGAAMRSFAHNRAANIDVLKKVPGIDPTLAVINSRNDNIPSNGWLISSTIAPGYGGEIAIYRYGTFKPLSIRGDIDKYGQVAMGYELSGHDKHTIVYENSESPNKDISGLQREAKPATNHNNHTLEIVDIGEGGRLLVRQDMSFHNESLLTSTLLYDDLEKRQEYDPEEFRVNRVTDDPETLGAILMSMGSSMGLAPKEVEVLLETIGNTANLVN